MTAPAPGPAPDGPPVGRSRRRWALAVLLVGLGLTASQLLPAIPREQVLVFELRGAPDARIQRVEATWSRQGEPVGGVVLRLPDPRRRVEHRVSLPDGEYVVSVQAWTHRHTAGQPIATPASTSGEPTKTTQVRRVNLGGGRIIIPLREGS